MLILTRKVGETICIGDNVIIHILGCRGNQSRIGITAPKSVTVDRQEIYEKKFSKNANSELVDLIQNPIQAELESHISVENKSVKKPKKKKEQ